MNNDPTNRAVPPAERERGLEFIDVLTIIEADFVRAQNDDRETSLYRHLFIDEDVITHAPQAQFVKALSLEDKVREDKGLAIELIVPVDQANPLTARSMLSLEGEDARFFIRETRTNLEQLTEINRHNFSLLYEPIAGTNGVSYMDVIITGEVVPLRKT